jgi:hypothetical protein
MNRSFGLVLSLLVLLRQAPGSGLPPVDAAQLFDRGLTFDQFLAGVAAERELCFPGSDVRSGNGKQPRAKGG